MGKFHQYFERAKSTGLDESIAVPIFEDLESLTDWLKDLKKDVDLDNVVAKDDVYDQDTEEILLEGGQHLSLLYNSLINKESNLKKYMGEYQEGWSPTMKKAMNQTSKTPEQRQREKAGDKRAIEQEKQKVNKVADRYYKKFKEKTDRDEYWEKEDRREKREEEREEKKFKGSVERLAKEYQDMGADAAGDFLYDMEQEVEKKKKKGITTEELVKLYYNRESEFNQWAQSAASEMGSNVARYPSSQKEEEELEFIKEREGIRDIAGWIADEIYTGMERKFRNRDKELEERIKATK